ncbi:MAG: LamG domain-containing protein [Candidatus Neomarinimicrobiota bacterium]
MSQFHGKGAAGLRLFAGILVPLMLVTLGCEEEPEAVNSVVLRGGAYVLIENRQLSGQPDSSLSAINDDIFSLEIWAAGEPLPAEITESPTLFMVSDDQGDNEIGIYRPANDSNRVFVFIGESYVGSYEIPGCDWFDPDVFTQVVITYDGTTARVFGNGKRLGSRALAVDLNIGSSHALIGADWDVANDPATLGNFWYGAVDEVRLWTKVLPEGEMAFRYQNPDKLTENYSPTGLDHLIGLWRFNREGQDNDIVPDGSGKGNIGILKAGAGQLEFTAAGA